MTERRVFLGAGMLWKNFFSTGFAQFNFTEPSPFKPYISSFSLVLWPHHSLSFSFAENRNERENLRRILLVFEQKS